MRRIVTLLLVAANVFLAVQIYRGIMEEKTPYNILIQKLENELSEEEEPYIREEPSSGPPYIPGSVTPTGQVTLGGRKTENKMEKYGTEDASVISKFQVFDWYRNDVLKNGLPSGTERITELQDIFGNYRVYVLFDPSDTNGSIADLLGDALIDAGQNGTTVHIDWTYVYYHKDGKGEADDSVSDFTGSLDSGKLQASGPGRITIDPFFRKDGKVRAIGTMEAPNGIPANIALEKR